MNAGTVASVVLGLTLGLGVFLVVTRSTRPAMDRSRRPRDWRTLLASAGIALAVFILCLAVTGVIGLAIALAGLGASVLPWLRSRRDRRTAREAEAAFPDLLEALISRLRSGDTLLGAAGVVCEDALPTIAGPAALFAANYRMTGNADASLDELKAGWSSATGDLLVETLRVAHHAGGTNTLDVLRDLADHVRQERNLRRDIEAKQSWVRVAARVGVAAPWVVLIFLSMRSEAVTAYNSPAGLLVLVVGLGLSVCAYWSMVALGRPEAMRRVFNA